MKSLSKFVCAAVFALVSGSAYAADDLAPADKKAMHDYTLSMDKVNGMQAAMSDFKKMSASDPTLDSQAKAVGDSSKSIAEMESKVKANPKLMGVYARHGLSAHDAVVMPFVLMYAGTAAAYPTAAAKIADETSPAQIAFVKAHQAELKKMNWLGGQ